MISIEEIRLRCVEVVPDGCTNPDDVIGYASELFHWVMEGKTVQQAMDIISTDSGTSRTPHQ